MRSGNALGLNPENCGRGLREHTANNGCGELGVPANVRSMSGCAIQNKGRLRFVRLESETGGLVTCMVRLPAGNGENAHKIV